MKTETVQAVRKYRVLYNQGGTLRSEPFDDVTVAEQVRDCLQRAESLGFRSVRAARIQTQLVVDCWPIGDWEYM